ncbi:hypothetical protein BDR04DRAFT_1123753, partial [Suillus decipiens]
ILWDGPALAECCVILNNIDIDIMDYIKPALYDPRDYLKHVMKSMNMSCLTPEGAMSGDCNFLSANIIEKTEAGIIGHVRIRSKTQDIALSLGAMSQKDSKPSI